MPSIRDGVVANHNGCTVVVLHPTRSFISGGGQGHPSTSIVGVSCCISQQSGKLWQTAMAGRSSSGRASWPDIWLYS